MPGDRQCAGRQAPAERVREGQPFSESDGQSAIKRIARRDCIHRLHREGRRGCAVARSAQYTPLLAILTIGRAIPARYVPPQGHSGRVPRQHRRLARVWREDIDQFIQLRWHSKRWGRIEHHRNATPVRQTGGGNHGRERHLELEQQHPRPGQGVIEAGRSGSSSALFAPGTPIMRFSALSTIVINATPDAWSGSRVTPAVSTWSAWSAAGSMAPKTSLPTRPTMLAVAPMRAAATAWFAPFPPGAVKKLCPRSGSPQSGKRGARTTRSILMLPKTTTPIPAPQRLRNRLRKQATRRYGPL